MIAQEQTDKETTNNPILVILASLNTTMILYRVFPILVAAVAMALPNPDKESDAPAPALCLPVSCCNDVS